MRELVDESAVNIIEAKADRATTDARIEAGKTVKERKLYEVIGKDVNRAKGKQVEQVFENVKDKIKREKKKGESDTDYQKRIEKEGIIDATKLDNFTKGKNIKALPSLVLPETVKLFVGPSLTLKQKKENAKLVEQGKKPKHKPQIQPDIHNVIARKIQKKANITREEIEAIQPMVDKLMPVIADYVIPEGFITKEVKYREGDITKSVQVPGESAGMPRSILPITHNKRSMAGVTTLDGRKVRTKDWRSK